MISKVFLIHYKEVKIQILTYYLILATAAVLSFIKTKNDKRLLIFSTLLLLSLIEELYFEWLLYKNKDESFYIIYHLFLPVYYGLFTWYLVQYLKKRLLKNVFLISIGIFGVTSISISFKLYHFTDYPSLPFNILGVLLIVDCLVILINLDVSDNISILNKPVFWIGVSTILFYSGTFSLMGFYNYLLKHRPKNEVNELQNSINVILNYLYYLFISFGMIWSKPTLRYSAQ
jgi:hypothetical protein